MCLSKSPVGCRAVSKVTSTNCWHSGIESTTEAQTNLLCLVRQNTPNIFLQKGKIQSGYLLSLTTWKANRTYGVFASRVLQFRVQQDYKPKSYSICLEALANTLRTGPEFMLSSPGSWWTTLISVKTAETLGKNDLGFTQWVIFLIEKSDTGIMTTLSTAFCTWVKRQMHSSNQSSMNKLYKTQIMPTD